LLGQSFFRNFKVEFNADARKLGLKRLETEETAAATATDDIDDDSRPAAKASAKSKRAARQPRTTARGKRSTRGRQAPPPDGFDTPTDGGELPD
jgi:hypothetical protein